MSSGPVATCSARIISHLPALPFFCPPVHMPYAYCAFISLACLGPHAIPCCICRCWWCPFARYRVYQFISAHRLRETPFDIPSQMLLYRQPVWIQHAVVERGLCGNNASPVPRLVALPTTCCQRLPGCQCPSSHVSQPSTIAAFSDHRYCTHDVGSAVNGFPVCQCPCCHVSKSATSCTCHRCTHDVSAGCQVLVSRVSALRKMAGLPKLDDLSRWTWKKDGDPRGPRTPPKRGQSSGGADDWEWVRSSDRPPDDQPPGVDADGGADQSNPDPAPPLPLPEECMPSFSCDGSKPVPCLVLHVASCTSCHSVGAHLLRSR